MMIVVNRGATQDQTRDAANEILRHAGHKLMPKYGGDAVRGALFTAWLNVALTRSDADTVLRDLNWAIQRFDQIREMNDFAQAERAVHAAPGHA